MSHQGWARRPARHMEGAMPEETTPAATAEPVEESTVKAAENPDAVKKALSEERKARRDAEKLAKDYEDRVRQFEDAQKSEQEKLNERMTAAEKRAVDAEARLLRHEVAREKSLPADLVGFLTADGKEELEQQADRLLSAVKPASSSFDGGVRGVSTASESSMDSLIRRAAGRE